MEKNYILVLFTMKTVGSFLSTLLSTALLPLSGCPFNNHCHGNTILLLRTIYYM